MQQNRHVQYLNNKEVHPQKNNTREATQLETLPVPRSTTGDDDDATMMMMLLRAALRRRAPAGRGKFVVPGFLILYRFWRCTTIRYLCLTISFKWNSTKKVLTNGANHHRKLLVDILQTVWLLDKRNKALTQWVKTSFCVLRVKSGFGSTSFSKVQCDHLLFFPHSKIFDKSVNKTWL